MASCARMLRSVDSTSRLTSTSVAGTGASARALLAAERCGAATVRARNSPIAAAFRSTPRLSSKRVRVQHGLDADAVLLARLPHRRNPLARREHAAAHGFARFHRRVFRRASRGRLQQMARRECTEVYDKSLTTVSLVFPVFCVPPSFSEHSRLGSSANPPHVSASKAHEETRSSHRTVHPPRRRLGRAQIRRDQPPQGEGDGRQLPHAVQAEPAGRLRLPRLRVAGSRTCVDLRVLRKRRQGRGRRGDQQARDAGVLRGAHALRS